MRALWAGIAAMVEGNRLHDIGLAVQTVAEGAGYSVVREYVGHGIGTRDARGTGGAQLLAGNARAQAQGGHGVRGRAHGQRRAARQTKVLGDHWSVVTADGSLSAHAEHTIAVTEDGPEVFTRAQ